MAKIKRVLQTPSFRKAVKKLHENQKQELDKAVATLMRDPLLGDQKKGDLLFLRVNNFNMINQLYLLGYSYEQDSVVLELLAPGLHENFYRDFKKK